MGSLYRSEEMRFCQMIVEKDAAFACVAEIGKKPFVEFKDLNSEVNSFQRMFVRDIRRFDEMERKLRFMENQIRKDEIEIVDNTWKEEVNSWRRLTDFLKEGSMIKEPIGYIVGVISHEKVNAFERILWRACRRTAFVRYCEIEEELENPDTGEKMHESVFIVFYNGDRLRPSLTRCPKVLKPSSSISVPRQLRKARRSSASPLQHH
uniref:V-type proton ATPase subunit a n=1 Tax=Ditylenchus dipsaci TaxID=166011 RepID=A0A915END3_9BILA